MRLQYFQQRSAQLAEREQRALNKFGTVMAAQEAQIARVADLMGQLARAASNPFCARVHRACMPAPIAIGSVIR